MLVGLDLGYWWLRQALTEVVANMGVLPVALLCESGPCPRLQDGCSLLPLLGWYQNTPPLPILVMGRSKEFLRRITFWRNKDDGLWGNTRLVNFMHEVDKAQCKLPRSRLSTWHPRTPPKKFLH
jgi:hypothetical protein